MTDTMQRPKILATAEAHDIIMGRDAAIREAAKTTLDYAISQHRQHHCFLVWGTDSLVLTALWEPRLEDSVVLFERKADTSFFFTDDVGQLREAIRTALPLPLLEPNP